jgi:multiple sugar transport system substrate-binding protein
LKSLKPFVVGIVALALMVPMSYSAHADTTTVTTIDFATWGSSPAETASLNDAVATFEARYPNIKVNLVVDSDHTAAMVAKFASHTPPDVFYVDSGIAQDWASQGVLQQLNSYVTGSNFSLAPFNPSYLAPFEVGTAVYGLPKDANPLVLEGNKTLMAKAGIKALPKTIADFDKDAKALLAKKVVPMCVDTDINRLAAYFFSFGGAVADSTSSQLNSAGTVAALTWALNNYKTGAFKTPASLSAGWAGEAFGKAKCAFTMEGAWVDPYLHDSFPAVYNSMIKGELPYKVHPASLAFTVSYSIGTDSPHKDAAWTFIQYMTSARGMGIWTSYGVALPSRTDVATPVGYEVNGAVAKKPTTHTMPAFVGWSKVVTAFNSEATKQVQNKNMNVASAVKAIISAANAAWPQG